MLASIGTQHRKPLVEIRLINRILLGSVLLASLADAKTTATVKPNVLLIIVDDLADGFAICIAGCKAGCKNTPRSAVEFPGNDCVGNWNLTPERDNSPWMSNTNEAD